MPAREGELWVTSARGRDAEGREQWSRVLSAGHLPWTVLPEERADTGARIRSSRWWLDDLALVEAECGLCQGVRHRKHIAKTDGEYLVLLAMRSGREAVSQAGVDVELNGGDALVWDSTRPMRFAVQESLVKRSLLVPRTVLRVAVEGPVVLDSRKPAVRLLLGYLETLSELLPDLDPIARGAARDAALELFAGALRHDAAQPCTPAAMPALREQMNRYIEHNLGEPGLSPASIAAAFAVSVRTVNRVFNASGQTAREVIRARRLERARAELARGELPVSAVASRWGFADTSHFSRTFKARFGISPTGYRRFGAVARLDNDLS